MKYELLDDLGTIHVHYEGPQLDALSLGVLEIQLHHIAEKVAFRTLIRDIRTAFELLDSPSLIPLRFWRDLHRSRVKGRDPLYLYEYYSNYGGHIAGPLRQLPLIRLRSTSIRSGSLFQELSVFVASTLSNPDVRAVLQGFGGNLLYAFVSCGMKGIEWVGEAASPPKDRHANVADTSEFDPFDVGVNVREIAKELIANSNGEASSIKITSKTKEGQHEVKIEVK